MKESIPDAMEQLGRQHPSVGRKQSIDDQTNNHCQSTGNEHVHWKDLPSLDEPSCNDHGPEFAACSKSVHQADRIDLQLLNQIQREKAGDGGHAHPVQGDDENPHHESPVEPMRGLLDASQVLVSGSPRLLLPAQHQQKEHTADDEGIRADTDVARKIRLFGCSKEQGEEHKTHGSKRADHGILLRVAVEQIIGISIQDRHQRTQKESKQDQAEYGHRKRGG